MTRSDDDTSFQFPEEPKTVLPATVPQLGLVGLLSWVLWAYRDSDWRMLVPAATAVVVAIVLFRFGNIRKLTSKLVSFETQPAVQQANAATKRANKAALEAKDTATKAAEAAAGAQREVARANQTIDELRKIGASLARISLDTLARANVMGEFPWSDKIRHRDDVKEKLRKLGLPESEIEDADRTFRELLRFQLPARALEAAREACLVARGGKADAVYVAFQEKTLEVLDYGSRSVPKPDHLRKVIGEHVDEDVERWLEEYERFDAAGVLTDRMMLDGRENEHNERSARVSRKVDARKVELAK